MMLVDYLLADRQKIHQGLPDRPDRRSVLCVVRAAARTEADRQVADRQKSHLIQSQLQLASRPVGGCSPLGNAPDHPAGWGQGDTMASFELKHGVFFSRVCH